MFNYKDMEVDSETMEKLIEVMYEPDRGLYFCIDEETKEKMGLEAYYKCLV